MTDHECWRIYEDARIAQQVEDAKIEHQRMKLNALCHTQGVVNFWIRSMAQDLRYYRQARIQEITK